MKPASNQNAANRMEGPSFLGICTLMLWLFCVAVGAAGIALPYPGVHVPTKEPEPVQAEVLNVDLTAEPMPSPDATPLPLSDQPPPLEPMTTPQAVPTMLAVAEPNPAIAFALPVKALAHAVKAEQAAYVRPTQSIVNAIMASARAPEQLVFGQGEGKQPAPDYPPRAAREGQEGTVTVRFSVDDRGRVLEAEASSPCPWPLLNAEALRVIRQSWRFHHGSARLFEVSIRFQLTKS